MDLEIARVNTSVLARSVTNLQLFPNIIIIMKFIAAFFSLVILSASSAAEEICEYLIPGDQEGITCSDLLIRRGNSFAPKTTIDPPKATSDVTSNCVKSEEEYDLDNDGTIDERRTVVYGLVSIDEFTFGQPEYQVTLEDKRDTNVDGEVDEEYENRWQYNNVVSVFFPTYEKEDEDTADGIVDKVKTIDYTYDDQGRIERVNTTTVDDDTDVTIQLEYYTYDAQGNPVLVRTERNGALYLVTINEYDDENRLIGDYDTNANGEAGTVNLYTYDDGAPDWTFRTATLSFGTFTVARTFNDQGSVVSEMYVFPWGSNTTTEQIYASDGVTWTAWQLYYTPSNNSRYVEWSRNGYDHTLSEGRDANGVLTERIVTTYSSPGVFSRREIDSDGDGMVDEIQTATSSPVACPVYDDGDKDCSGILCFIGNILGFFLFCF